MGNNKIYVFDVDYKTVGSNTIVEIFGIDDSKNFKKIEDDSFKPYFIAEVPSKENIDRIKNIAVKYKGDLCRVMEIQEIPPKKYLGRLKENLYQIKCNIPNAVKKLRDYLKELRLIKEDYESDIPFYRRYMIDKNVIPLKELVYDEEKKEFLEGEKILMPRDLRVLSLDIEVFTRHGYPDPKRDPIIAVSFFDGRNKKLLMLKNLSKDIIEKYDFVECVTSERQLIKRMIDFIKKNNPHIILTYNGDSFDFKYIKQRASNLGVCLDIGVNSEEVKFVRRGREFSAKVPGRIHIDLFKFISTVISPSLKTPVLTLDAVASELLGEKKLEIDWDLFMTEWIRATPEFLENFINYTIRDAILTYKLGMEFLDFIFELSRILLLPPFDVCRFSFSSFVDQYLMKNSKKYDELIPRKPSDDEIKKRLEVSYEGAFVYRPKPGLYENVAVFDFRSLYPSIIITFNISPDTLNREDCKNNCYKTPPIEKGGQKVTYWFCKSPKGFIPGVLEEVYKERVRLKKRLKSISKDDPEYKILDSKQQALKTILNATYGYMGYPQARFYSLECAEAITAFGREFIKKTIDFFEKNGFKVIYGDSVSKDTEIIIKDREGVKLVKIEDLFKKVDLVDSDGKEYYFTRDIETLTINEDGKVIWKPIKYVMKHKIKKKMYRVWITNDWYVDVTEDHSLICYSNKSKNLEEKNFIKNLRKIRPTEAKNKTLLFIKRFPRDEKRNNSNINEKFWLLAGTLLFRHKRDFTSNDCKECIEFRINEDATTDIVNHLQKVGIVENILIDKEKKHIKIRSPTLVKWLSKLNDSLEFLLNLPKDALTAFLRGILNNEKLVIVENINSEIRLKVLEERVCEFVRKALWMLGIPNITFKDNFASIVVKDAQKFRDILQNGSNKNLERHEKEADLYFVKVQKIERIEYNDYVYDIEVEDTHMFFANGILVHNTDSLFLHLKEKNLNDVLKILEKWNNELPGCMELEFDKLLKRILFIEKKLGREGAKKKYAACTDKNEIIIKGFEAIRRDWAEIVKEAQKKVLNIILVEGNVEKAKKYIENLIEKIKKYEIPVEKFVIYEKLTKDIEKYEQKGPHVHAAMKLKQYGYKIEPGFIIRYVICKGGGSISDRAYPIELVKKLNLKYDPSYYIQNQLYPAIERIFEALNVRINGIIKESKQKTLFDFLK